VCTRSSWTAGSTLPSSFGEIILRANQDGSTLRLRDVARIELGALNYEFTGKLNSELQAPIIVNLRAGANAIATPTRSWSAWRS